MNGFLSIKTKQLKKPDFLLQTWHLYHLHLSMKAAANEHAMKKNRSDTQLLCMVTDSEALFVDVISHPERSQDYFDIQHLKIIVNNEWESYIGLSVIPNMIPGSLEPKVTEGSDIFNLYKKGVNLGFEFDGHGYMLLKPMTSDRQPFEALDTINKIDKQLRSLVEHKNDFRRVELLNSNGVVTITAFFESSGTESSTQLVSFEIN